MGYYYEDLYHLLRPLHNVGVTFALKVPFALTISAPNWEARSACDGNSRTRDV